jgi:hypothetical protein
MRFLRSPSRLSQEQMPAFQLASEAQTSLLIFELTFTFKTALTLISWIWQSQEMIAQGGERCHV